MGLKSSYSRLARLFKKSRDAWRAKAIARRKENRLLELRIRDLEVSREKWKEKALTATQAPKPGTDKTEKDGEEDLVSRVLSAVGESR
jgi:phage shock protein A